LHIGAHHLQHHWQSSIDHSSANFEHMQLEKRRCIYALFPAAIFRGSPNRRPEVRAAVTPIEGQNIGNIR
jgi:hypothetical protein